MSNLRDIKCSRCKCYRTEEDFISNERKVKACIKCREIQKRYFDKNKQVILEKQKKYNNENKQVILEKQKQIYQENKEVVLEKRKQHYQTNKEVILEKQQQHYQENKEVILEKQKQIYQENKEVILEKHKQHYEENKEVILEKQKQNREKNKTENPLHIKFNAMINNSKTNDKKKNRTYEADEYITKDYLNELWVKQDKKCWYEDCECELILCFNKDTREDSMLTIQRLNNDISHTKDNCVLSCFRCNQYHKEDADFYKKMVEKTKTIN